MPNGWIPLIRTTWGHQIRCTWFTKIHKGHLVQLCSRLWNEAPVVNKRIANIIFYNCLQFLEDLSGVTEFHQQKWRKPIFAMPSLGRLSRKMKKNNFQKRFRDKIRLIHPRKTNMEPENNAFGKGETSTNHQFLGSMLVSGLHPSLQFSCIWCHSKLFRLKKK